MVVIKWCPTVFLHFLNFQLRLSLQSALQDKDITLSDIKKCLLNGSSLPFVNEISNTVSRTNLLLGTVVRQGFRFCYSKPESYAATACNICSFYSINFPPYSICILFLPAAKRLDLPATVKFWVMATII